MNIKIWGDFACPFCYIGETQLESIIKESGLEDKTTLQFMAYELDSEAPEIPVETMLQHFMNTHDMTEEEAKAQMERITKMASRFGLAINIAGVKVCSTFDAHRLMKYAGATASPATVIKLNFALFKANFVDNLRLSDKKVLIDIAETAGLERREVEKMLETQAYGEQVRNEELEAENRDLEYVPYMVFDDKTVLQGVISNGAMKKALAGESPE